MMGRPNPAGLSIPPTIRCAESKRTDHRLGRRWL